MWADDNKLASLVATLVRNYDPATQRLTYLLTGVKCRATSVAKNYLTKPEFLPWTLGCSAY